MPTLKLPDGNTLQHGESAYDPVKAREYYLRTRELKGRKKGSEIVPASGTPRRAKSSGSVTVTYNGASYKLTPRQLAEQKAYADKRVKSIQGKIRKLESALREKLAKARKTEKEAKKPNTAAEKRDAAKKSEEYRDKNQQKLKNEAKKAAAKKAGKSEAKKAPDLNTTAGLKTAIASAQRGLRKAVERQRALSSAQKG